MPKCQVCRAEIPDGLTYCPPTITTEHSVRRKLTIEFDGCEVLALRRYGMQPPVRNVHYQKGYPDAIEDAGEPTIIICGWCDDEFIRVDPCGARPKYCRDKCRKAAIRVQNTAWSRANRKPWIARDCCICGSPVLPPRRKACCDECSRKHKTNMERARVMALK